MLDLGKIVSVIVLVAVSPLVLPVCRADHDGVAITPTDLSAEDLAIFHRIHWHAFHYALAKAPDAIGYDLITYAEGKKEVLPGLSDHTASARKPHHRFAVLYRESPDKSKLQITVRFNDLSSYYEIDNPFADLSMITLKSSTVDPEGRVVLAIALEPGDTHINPEDKTPETAYRCLVIRIRTQKQGAALDFKSRQRQLFHEIDHKSVYNACQELMRRSRAGKLSARTYYCDDPQERLSEVPESLLALEPTSVGVMELMVTVTFLSGDGMQYLRCTSNEFGEPAASQGETKGLGFRTDPYAMDELTGTESLDYLNENYEHFEIELIPGLGYEVFGDESPRTLEAVKQSNEGMDEALAFMQKIRNELVVKKQRLLYRVDHQELLKACRESITRFNDGVFSRAKINVPPSEFKDEPEYMAEFQESAEDLKHIPKIILDLEPVYIWFNEGRVIVALIGGLDHAGVQAYAKDEEAVPRDDDIKLINGLLYYDDGLREAEADYKDYLKSLQNEAIPYLDWSRKQRNLPIPHRDPVN